MKNKVVRKIIRTIFLIFWIPSVVLITPLFILVGIVVDDEWDDTKDMIKSIMLLNV